MLALLPENIEVQMFRKIAAVAALWLPTLGQAEVVEFKCIQNVVGVEFPTFVAFDTTSHRVRLNVENWIDAAVWNDQAIIWTYVDNDPTFPSITSYMFKRETTELLNSGLSLSSFEPEDFRIYPQVMDCRRPF